MTVPKPRMKSFAAMLLGVGLLVLLAGLSSLPLPYCPDQNIFAYVGETWLQGGLPYRDAWDIKPPGIFAVFAGAIAAFGDNMAACRLADLFFTLAGSLLFAAFAARRWNLRVAAIAGVLTGALYFSSFDYGNSAQPESYAFLPIAALLLFAEIGSAGTGWLPWLLAGVSFGCALIFKQTFIFLLPVVVFLGLGPKPVLARRAVFTVLGTAIPVILMVAYFWARGGLSDLLEVQRAEAEYAATSPKDALSFMLPFFLFAGTYPLIGVTGAVGILLTGSKRLAPFMAKTAAAWILLFSTIAVVVVQRRFFPYHFIPVVPAIALVAAIGLDAALRFSERAAKPVFRYAAVASAVLLVAAPLVACAPAFATSVALESGRLPRRRFYEQCTERNLPGNVVYHFIAAWGVRDLVDPLKRPGDTMLCYYAFDSFNALCGLPAQSRFFFVSGVWPSSFMGTLNRQLRHDCMRNPPTFLVTYGPWYPPGTAPLTSAGRSRLGPPLADMLRTPGLTLFGFPYERVGRSEFFSVFRLSELNRGRS